MKVVPVERMTMLQAAVDPSSSHDMENEGGEVRIVVAEALALVAEGVRSWLAPEPGLCVVDDVRGGAHLLERLEKGAVDLVLMDVSLPGMDGIDTTRTMRKRFPAVKVLAQIEL